MLRTKKKVYLDAEMSNISEHNNNTIDFDLTTNNKLFGFNRKINTGNIESFCSNNNNISMLECQHYCPINNPESREPWCDKAMKNYCKTDIGKKDTICSCINSSLSNIPSACFDPVCNQYGYKLFDNYPSLNNCSSFCDQILDTNDFKNIDPSHIKKICGNLLLNNNSNSNNNLNNNSNNNSNNNLNNNSNNNLNNNNSNSNNNNNNLNNNSNNNTNNLNNNSNNNLNNNNNNSNNNSTNNQNTTPNNIIIISEENQPNRKILQNQEQEEKQKEQTQERQQEENQEQQEKQIKINNIMFTPMNNLKPRDIGLIIGIVIIFAILVIFIFILTFNL